MQYERFENTGYISSELDAEELVCTADGYCRLLEPDDTMPEELDVAAKAFDNAVDEWSETLENGRQMAVSLRATLDNHNELTSYRLLSRQGRRGELATRFDSSGMLVRARDNALSIIQARLAEVTGLPGLRPNQYLAPYTPIAQCQSVLDSLETLHDQAVNGEVGILEHAMPFLGLPIDDKPNPYLPVFAKELAARAQLLLMSAEYPDMVRSQYSSRNLSLIPLAQLRFALTDINQGKGSILLSLFDKPSAPNAVTDVELQEYLTSGRVSKQAAELLHSIKLGACAMGAVECRGSDSGLCTQVLDRITFEALPALLQADVADQQATATDVSMQALRALMKRDDLAISRWWQTAAVITDNRRARQGATDKKSRRGGNNLMVTVQQPTTKQSLQDSLRDTHAERPGLPAELSISWPGMKEPIIIPSNDEQQKAGIVEAIMGSPEFTAYTRKHAEDVNLPSVLRGAVLLALFTPIYRHERAIQRLPYLRAHRAHNAEFPVWRVRADGMELSGSKASRQTRLYFGMLGTEATRRVHLIGVRHKTDIEKSSTHSGWVI